MSLLHFLPTTTVLFCALCALSTVRSYDSLAEYNKLTPEEKATGMAVWLIILIVIISLCISGCAAAGMFYMMRKRNSGGDQQVLVVR